MMKTTGPLKVIAVFVLVAICVVCGYIYYWNHPELWREFRMGQQVIRKIDGFQAEHHRLPDNMDAIESKYSSESGPIYYEKLSATHYHLWFGMSLGESYTYDSETKQWK